MSGIPFDDASGDRLREWLQLDRATFYDVDILSIIPMGFCFPGYDRNGGDLPPRAECRALWHRELFAAAPPFELLVCIGAHAARYHLARLGLGPDKPVRMHDLVAEWRPLAQRTPQLFVLPHPSWRNTAWLRRNPWFETEVLPELRSAVTRAIESRRTAKNSA